jgi:hypothetical protein
MNACGATTNFPCLRFNNTLPAGDRFRVPIRPSALYEKIQTCSFNALDASGFSIEITRSWSRQFEFHFPDKLP